MNTNQTCFTHDYKVSSKLINYEQNGMTLNLLPLFFENSVCALMGGGGSQSQHMLYYYNHKTSTLETNSFHTLAMHHYFKPKQPYPLICTWNFLKEMKNFKTLPFLPIFLDYDRISQSSTRIKHAGICLLKI